MFSSMNMQFLARQEIDRNKKHEVLKIRHRQLKQRRNEKIRNNASNLFKGKPCRESTVFTTKGEEVQEAYSGLNISYGSISSFESVSNFEEEESEDGKFETEKEEEVDFNVPIKLKRKENRETEWKIEEENIDLQIAKLELEMQYIKVKGPESKKPIDFILDRFSLSTDILTNIIKMLEETLDSVVFDYLQSIEAEKENIDDLEKKIKYYDYKEV